MSERPDIVFVHGAWHGAWVWDRVLNVLGTSGWTAAALDLPGHGNSTEPSTDLHGDADAVRDAVTARGRPTVLVGHSYGGMVITDAGDHDDVVSLVYVAAFLPDEGESLMSSRSAAGHDEPSELDTALEPSADGTSLLVDPDAALTLFYDDCAPDLRHNACERLDPQRLDTFTQAPRSLAWRSKPTTYVVCTRDRALDERHQRRMAQGAGRVVELPSSHSPFLSMPERLTELVTTAIMEDLR